MNKKTIAMTIGVICGILYTINLIQGEMASGICLSILAIIIFGCDIIIKHDNLNKYNL